MTTPSPAPDLSGSPMLTILRDRPTATYAELARACGLSSKSSSYRYVQLLKEAGLVREGKCECCGGRRWEVIPAQSGA